MWRAAVSCLHFAVVGTPSGPAPANSSGRTKLGGIAVRNGLELSGPVTVDDAHAVSPVLLFFAHGRDRKLEKRFRECETVIAAGSNVGDIA
jgi:hypothetical protein